MFGEGSAFVTAKRKAPAFQILFQYARQSLAFSFDIAKDAMPNSRYYYATQNEGIDICFICILNALLFLSIFKTPTNTKLNAIY